MRQVRSATGRQIGIIMSTKVRLRPRLELIMHEQVRKKRAGRGVAQVEVSTAG